MAAAALSAAMPVLAGHDSIFGSGTNTANNWSSTAIDVILQELPLVPALHD
ncbi:hypothetical protein ACWGK1_00895 [Streptomyces wedmorensis]